MAVRLPVPRIPGTGDWSDDPLYAAFYDFGVSHPLVGVPAWRLALASDLRLLYAAAAEIGRQPAGTRVLDVPCGGGVALRAVRPGQGLDYLAADISPGMLDRTRRLAERLGVAEQVSTRTEDVGRLQLPAASVDLVVSFTGLHCFPDPARAVAEMARVLRPGGVITGSAVLNDTGLRHEPLRRVGRLSGLMGPGCTGRELLQWLGARKVLDAELKVSGAIGYFRGTKSA